MEHSSQLFKFSDADTFNAGCKKTKQEILVLKLNSDDDDDDDDN